MKLPDNFGEIIAQSVPTDAEFEKAGQDRIARRANPQNREKALQHTTKLSDWLVRCRQAGVPAIPATFSPEISCDELIAALDGAPSPTLDAAAEWLDQNHQTGMMWRWEQCAPEKIKACMANQQNLPEKTEMNVDDPRLIDILYETNCATTALALRPIVTAQKYAGYPVEFRCYVDQYGGIAVSNYYPQMSLPESFRPQAEQAGKLARKLLPFVGEAFTADFLIQPDGQPVFIEGGPAWGVGAHPCCFNPAKLAAGRILLAPEPGAML